MRKFYFLMQDPQLITLKKNRDKTALSKDKRQANQKGGNSADLGSHDFLHNKRITN